MNLLEKILNCTSNEEIDQIIKEEIERKNANAEKIEQLGFRKDLSTKKTFKGFIPLETRIKYSNLSMETYKMSTTDFIYEFAHFVKEHNIDKKSSIVQYLEFFIRDYFGTYKTMSREEIFNDIAWNSTTTDEEYFKALENNELGNLKGLGAAECTEISALAQQVLSLFGFDIDYCVGCVEKDGKQEAHCFNVIKRKNDYVLADYSLPMKSFKSDGTFKGMYPFIGILNNEEYENFINNGYVKSFNELRIVDGKIEVLNSIRLYVNGSFKIEKEESFTK